MDEVGFQPGWSVLDAGCGIGSYHHAISRSIGVDGSILALDLAEENIRFTNCLATSAARNTIVRSLVGKINQIPIKTGAFDCIWTANVLQYLTAEGFSEAIEEFKRVLRRGGTLAIKEADTSLYQIDPIDPFLISRLQEARRKYSAPEELLGPWSGTSISRRLREKGINPIKRKGQLVERWAPLDQSSLNHIEDMILYFSSLSEQLPISTTDRDKWRDICNHRHKILSDPDLCTREFFVITIAVL
ncbi:methyltransferase domain-containing protein (plasmid) [Methylobacterium sp. SyP6R]|nr:methyltransferase domain-containing protein [Methylobacterium sp. SyP6R]